MVPVCNTKLAKDCRIWLRRCQLASTNNTCTP